MVALAQSMCKSNFPLIIYYNQNGLKQGRIACLAKKFDRQLRQLSAYCALPYLLHARVQSVFVSVSERLIQVVHGVGAERVSVLLVTYIPAMVVQNLLWDNL